MRYLSRNLIECKKGEGFQLSKNFNSVEFEDNLSPILLIDIDLISKLEDIRDIVCTSINITSGFRSKAKQLQLKSLGYETSSKTSTHEVGSGVDIMVKGYSGIELEKIARMVGIRAVGVGTSFIHIDMRSDRDRRWDYKV